MDGEVGRLKADLKVIQKGTSNLKRMWLAIRFSQSGRYVSWDPNKILILTNYNYCIVYMYKIYKIPII